MGYIEPGHGAKGKMRQLNDDDALKEMYVLHKRIRDILLWMHGDTEGTSTDPELSTNTDGAPLCKCSHTDTSTSATKRDSIATTISQVEAIIEKLKETHGEKGYSVEHFNCWTHMINSGKWSSYDSPPDFPF